MRRLPPPLWVLVAVAVASLAIRGAWLGAPCHRPCRNAADHQLVFDETFYVPAARSIAGTPAIRGQGRYAGTPRGDDPNSEHPQLEKLLTAGAIELLGDGPLAWRLVSLVAGTAALLGMYSLTRAAGGGPWLGVGAAALLAADNLALVHGRIGTLDMPVLAAMLGAVTLYLRRRPLAAGALLGVAASLKLVGAYALLVVALYELLCSSEARRARGRAVASTVVSAAVVLVGLLAVLDRLAPPWDPTRGRVVGGGPVGHLAHMLTYGAAQVSPHGPQGIASLPWEWLVDFKPIPYLVVDPLHPAPGLTGLHPAVHFLGVISPPILLLGLGGLVWLARSARSAGPESLAGLCLAWFAGTFVPFAVLSLVWQRTSYLYYMLVVMPALYLAAALAAARLRDRRPRVVRGWMMLVGLALVALYPLTPLPGS